MHLSLRMLRIPDCSRALLSSALLLAVVPCATAQKIAFGAVLDGGQMVPPVATSARATASLVMDLAANTLTYDLTHTGLGATELSAQVHGYAAPGANAPALTALPLGFKKGGVWNYPPADEAQILASLAYLQISTTTFPGGEIRGQILRDASPMTMSASLDGAQEVPPNASPAKGSAFCKVDTQINRLTFALSFDGITSPQTAAHIHGPANFGEINGVKFDLPVGAGNHLVGIWDYPESDEADILGGLMYFNVHSNAIQTGEIRGQILPLATNPNSYCTAKTTSLGCTPAIAGSGYPSATAGSGFVITAAPVPGGNLGIFFYGKTGPAAMPFQGGTFCVQSPVLRTPISSSGGTTGVCNGAYSIDFNAYVAGGADPALVSGTVVSLQTWFRDPPEPISGTGLSDALLFTLRN
jgi:hypothetical protein